MLPRFCRRHVALTAVILSALALVHVPLFGSSSEPAPPAPAPRSGNQTAPAARPPGASTSAVTAPSDKGPLAPRADAAIARGLTYLEQTDPNPHLVLFMNNFYRRFGMTRFRDAAAIFDMEMKMTNESTLAVMRGLRRLIDARNGLGVPVSDLCVPGADLQVCPALYCDRAEAPATYAETLRASLARGGYELSHIGMAMMVAQDLGCADFIPAEIASGAVDGMKKLVAVDGRLTDLEMESATTLTYLGHGSSIPEGFAEEILAHQKPNGGWDFDSATPQERGNWHATTYAIWYLLESRPVPRPRPTMVPRG